MELSKEERIKKELSRLKKLYKEIPKNKLTLLTKLLDNAAYMAVTLEDLQQQVNEEGAIITIINGNGLETTTEHPAQKSYSVMVSKYASVIKQLGELLPEQPKAKSKLELLMSEDE